MEEFEKKLGKDFVKLASEVEQLKHKIDVNKRVEKDLQDKTPPLVLLAPPKEEVISTNKRFGASDQNFKEQLTQQHNLINLFQKRKVKGDYEFPETFPIVSKDERPSLREIEHFRGDIGQTLIDDSIQKAQNFIKKYQDYFKMIENVKSLNQIPTEAEKALMLENFEKYLEDARYYLKFVAKYSTLWTKEPSKIIVPYHGLYIPVEKRKILYDFDHPAESFHVFRELMYKEKETTGGISDLNRQLPELAMYYSKSTFVPPMKKKELESLYYPIRSQEVKVPNLGLPVPTNKEDTPFQRQDWSIYLNRQHMVSVLKRTFCSYYDPTSTRWIQITGQDFLDNVTNLAHIYTHVELGLLIHSFSNQMCKISCIQYIVLLYSFISLGIPIMTMLDQSDSDFIANINFDKVLVATFDDAVIQGKHQYLYYGPNEPNTIVHSKKGKLTTNDPISSILKPTKEKVDQETEPLWDYVPFKVDGYKEMLASTKSSTTFPTKNVISDSRFIFVKNNETFTVSNHDMEQIVKKLDNIIGEYENVLCVGLGVNHPMFLPLILLFVQKKMTFHFLADVANLNEIDVSQFDLVLSNRHDMNLIRNVSTRRKHFFESNLLYNLRNLIKSGAHMKTIGVDGEISSSLLFDHLYACEMFVNTESRVIKESTEIMETLSRELNFYETVSDYLKTNHTKSHPWYQDLLKELEIVTKNYNNLNQEDIKKYLDARIALTKASLDMMGLNQKIVEKKELIMQVSNAKYIQSQGSEKDQLMRQSAFLVELQTGIHLCYIGESDGVTKGIISHPISQKEWSCLLIPNLPKYQHVKWIPHLQNFEIFDAEGEFVPEKMQKFISLKSKL